MEKDMKFIRERKKEFLILRGEKHTPRVFENRALRRIFGPKEVEVIGGWRKLHGEELHNF
jgi:hypothetical protein